MESKFFGVTANDIKTMAYQLAVRNGIKHPFGEGKAGRGWIDHFLTRHRNKISLRKPVSTSCARTSGFTKENVDAFFDILDQQYNKHHYTPDRIYNVNETGLTMVQSKVPSVVELREETQVTSLTATERRALITLVCCMNAAGSFVPPMFIFPRKSANKLLMKGAPCGSIDAYHPSGWIQASLFTKWFEHFLDFAKPSEKSPVLLILDGHYNHTHNVDVLELARKNFVSLVSLPPHSRHKLQPLDKTFVGPLKAYYSEAVQRVLHEEQRTLRPVDSSELLGKAYLNVERAEVAINGFRVTGIYPLNRDIFSEADFIASDRETASPTEETAKLEPEKSFPVIAASTTTDIVPQTPDLNTAPSTSNESLQLVNPYDLLQVVTAEPTAMNRRRKAESFATMPSLS